MWIIKPRALKENQRIRVRKTKELTVININFKTLHTRESKQRINITKQWFEKSLIAGEF